MPDNHRPGTGRGRSQAWSRSACPSLRGRAVRLQGRWFIVPTWWLSSLVPGPGREQPRDIVRPLAAGMPESARAGWSLSGPGVHLAGARAEDLGGGLRARISPLGIDRPIAGRMTLPADRRPASQPGVGRERRATFAGPVVHLGGTLAIPDRVWRRSPMSCARVSGLFGSHPILGNVARQGFGIAGYNALFKVYITDILILTNVNEIACKLIIRLVLRG